MDTFLKNVLRSGLLDREQLQAAVIDVPAGQREKIPEPSPNTSSKRESYRDFQANKLLKGTAKGLILGNYQILAPLGKGGIGTVYIAPTIETVSSSP